MDRGKGAESLPNALIFWPWSRLHLGLKSKQNRAEVFFIMYSFVGLRILKEKGRECERKKKRENKELDCYLMFFVSDAC